MGQTQKSEDEGSRWFFSKTADCRGVVLLVHGLNQRPSSWRDMLECLNGMALHVYRLSLQGHRGAGDGEMATVSRAIWQGELVGAYQEICRVYPDLPRYFVGFSMGCLLAMTVQLQLGRPLFAAQLLLAPALRVHSYTRLVLPVSWLINPLPSRAAQSYVANRRGVSLAGYRALFDLEKEFCRARNLAPVNIPTRILMRRNDELISCRQLDRMISDHNLTQWQLLSLPDEMPYWRQIGRFQHLVVDNQSAGKTSWQFIESQTAALFASSEE